MSSQPAFCAYCGAAIPPGSVFCGSCGQRVAATPTPPQGPAAYPSPPPPPASPPPAPSSAPTSAAPAKPRRRSTARATAKKRGPSVGSALLLTLVGLMLILFGLRGPILQVAGATAIGAVTSVTQDTSDEDSAYTYNISYSFRTPDGQQRNGMTTRSNVLNAASLPAGGSRVTVRYLPAAPFINAPAGEAKFSLGTIALLAIGALVIYLGWRPR